jgi:hypothetical protein
MHFSVRGSYQNDLDQIAVEIKMREREFITPGGTKPKGLYLLSSLARFSIFDFSTPNSPYRSF